MLRQRNDPLNVKLVEPIPRDKNNKESDAVTSIAYKETNEDILRLQKLV